MGKQDNIRRSVAKSYAKAITSGGGCCGGDGIPQGTFAKLANYSREELDSLPPDAVVSSFGCGNPLAFSEVKEGDVVLDLGSGAGIDLLLAAKHVGTSGRVIGVDMTDEMIAEARKNIAATGLANIEVRKGLIEELPVDTGSVDWVISNCVVNLSPNKPRVFAEIARVLKPGGKVRISDIVTQDLPAWVRQSEALYSICVAGAISESDYLQGLRDAGLRQAAVQERIVYDAAQLRNLLACEAVAADVLATTNQPTENTPLSVIQDSCCDCRSPDRAQVDLIVAEFTGKVWSAIFVAVK